MIDFETIGNTITKHTWSVHALLGYIQKPHPNIYVGQTGPVWFRRPYHLRGTDNRKHKWFFGKTGYGKSKAIANYAYQLFQQNIGFALLDPAGDLARDVMWTLADSGYFADFEKAQKRLMYIDFSNPDRFIAWNVLKRNNLPTDTHTKNIVKAFKRMWPNMEEIAVNFENNLYYSVYTLIENDLPLTDIIYVLNDKEFRDRLLKNVSDPYVRDFFYNRYEKLEQRRPDMKESTANKISLLFSTDAIRNCFSQNENNINFREIMDTGKAIIFDLGNVDEDTQKLLGSLIALGFEQAAMSREDIPDENRREFHVIEDEFFNFAATSQTTFQRGLAMCRKYNVFFDIANQHLSQLTPEMIDALSSAIKFVFRTAVYEDRAKLVRELWDFDDAETKDPPIPDETHGGQAQYENVPASYERWVHKLKYLHNRSCIIFIEDWVEEVKTAKYPEHTVSYETVKEIKKKYAELLTAKAIISELTRASQPPPPASPQNRRRRRSLASSRSVLW